MITKDRLEELIKQGATIYYIKKETFVAGYSNFIGIKEIELYSPKQCKILEKYYNNEDYLIVKYGNGAEYFLPDNLFETKEEAEEVLEFGNIQRTQKLKLPLWNDIKNKHFEFIEFNIYGEFDKVCIFDFNLDHDINTNMEISIWDDDENQEIIFDKPLTKENYDEARRICKKLFLGE